jgi:hypothetical protein
MSERGSDKNATKPAGVMGVFGSIAAKLGYSGNPDNVRIRKFSEAYTPVTMP